MNRSGGIVAVIAISLLATCPATPFAATDMVGACQSGDIPAYLPRDSVRILTLNISHGRKTAINQLFVSKKRTYQNLDEIAALLDNVAPDIVALQEADAPSRWSGNFDHVAYVAEQTGIPCHVHGRHSQSWISSYGTALLSRSKPTDSASVRFPTSWPSKQKGYVMATFAWPAGQGPLSITLVSVHFDFMRKSVRDRQVREMVEGLSTIDGPLILMGDLNSDWESDTSQVRRLTDQLDLRAFYPERGGLGTYKSTDGKRLDWILITKNLEFKSYRVLPDVVSDHFAVFAEIVYRGHYE